MTIIMIIDIVHHLLRSGIFVLSDLVAFYLTSIVIWANLDQSLKISTIIAIDDYIDSKKTLTIIMIVSL